MLNGAVVRLRPVREDDLEWLVAETGKPSALGEFEPFVLGAAEALRREFEYDGLLSDDRTRLVIEDRAGKRVGVASIDQLDSHSRVARIAAIVLDPQQRGKGCGTDAHRVLVSYLFRHRNMARVEAFVERLPAAEEWRDLVFRLPVEGPLPQLRLALPRGACELRRLEIKDAKGAVRTLSAPAPPRP